PELRPELEKVLNRMEDIKTTFDTPEQEAVFEKLAIDPVKSALEDLTKIARERFVENLLKNTWFITFAGIAVYVVTLLVFWQVLLAWRPLLVMKIDQALGSESAGAVRQFLEKWLGSTFTGFLTLPLPTLLLVRRYRYHPKVLTAW